MHDAGAAGLAGTTGADGTGLDPLVTVPVTGSTQDDLRVVLAGAQGHQWPHLSALRAVRQTAGRGRAGRTWRTPAEGALTVSVVLRPLVAASRLAWLPLLAGLAVCEALTPLAASTPWRLGIKWPNDVVALPGDLPGRAAPATGNGLLPGADTRGPAPDLPEELDGWGGARKVAGVLAELVAPEEPGRPAPSRAREPDAPPPSRERAPAVILGVGVNVAQEARELPAPWATSLRLLGARTTPEEALALVGRRLNERLAQWEALAGDPDAGEGRLGRDLRSVCTTLGQQVQARTPSGVVRGVARDIRPALVLDTPEGDRHLQAGDVSLLRPEPSRSHAVNHTALS